MTEHDDTSTPTRAQLEEVYAKKELGLLLYRLQNMPADSRARVQGRFTQQLIDETLSVETPHGPLSFVLLGRSAGARAMSLLTKQPVTIDWISRFRPGSVFWDIGANVGVYTLFAARRGDISVVAIEPAAVNYFLLSANCEINKLDDRVHCLLAGLGRGKGVERIEVSQFSPAESFSFRGKRDRPYVGHQAALIVSMDVLIEEFGVACPNYIKIDVPGMTPAIIDGAARTLRRPEVLELHVELREESKDGQRILEILTEAGFVASGRDGHGGSADTTFVRPGA